MFGLSLVIIGCVMLLIARLIGISDAIDRNTEAIREGKERL